ncbi:glutathione S-transferase N-terminal domain-containing protein [Dyella flava]|uniref:Glutathione S-transferase N-terminal domain-containing protein n=1 Tax=Dyella flava TaxID=1920170 RepID=A0ABS2JZ99_9GAMM|nr:glutathione S-transferase N-terminal domain-containing protein [Dyella flava]MBM7124216.1 glutathione S-transferase N-terminal domain-containing protein [Dyella flava]GLQ50507.1 thiol:disulfide oxidoreductase [Dyella flava]
MIDLYTWKTPNGRKPVIALEALQLDYVVHPVDINRDEQFLPNFVAVSPNSKIPAIVDRENGMKLFESGAILQYLAEKTGKLLPTRGATRYSTLQWLNWQVGGVGPMFGQLGFFANRAKERLPLAVNRYLTESNRLLDVLEQRLSQSAYVGSDDYSIADIAIYPWVVAVITNNPALLADARANRPSMDRWMTKLAELPDVIKGMNVLQEAGVS